MWRAVTLRKILFSTCSSFRSQQTCPKLRLQKRFCSKLTHDHEPLPSEAKRKAPRMEFDKDTKEFINLMRKTNGPKELKRLLKEKEGIQRNNHVVIE